MSDSNATPPPPYDAMIELGDPNATFRRAFATLASDHQDIMNLFRDVAQQLAIAQEFGPRHPLTEEWDSMRQVRIILILATTQHST